MVDRIVNLSGRGKRGTLSVADKAYFDAQVVNAESASLDAQAARDVAADLVLPQNKVVGGTLAAAEAQFTAGTKFAWVHDGMVDVRERTVGGSTFLLSQPTTAALAMTSGAASIGANDGVGGSLWSTLAGFINYLRSSSGGTVIGFIQAGTGAVIRTIRAKLGETVSVMDFGAVGDGVTDDGPAIQRGINYLLTTRFKGGTLLFPTPAVRYAMATTVTLQGAEGLILKGSKRGVAPGQSSSGYPGSIMWTGALNGVMFQVNDPLQIIWDCLEIRGGQLSAPLAATGISINQTKGGWGLCDYKYLAMDGFTRAPIRFTGTASIDGGQNRFHKCTIWNRHAATGTPEYDCCIAYENASNVQDVYDQCAFIYEDGNLNKIPNTYAIYFKSGNPQLYIDECFSRADKGIYVATGSPFLRFTGHYSEDREFLTAVNPNVHPVVLRDTVHATVSGGHSISWVGPSNTPIPFIIDGGWYPQSVAMTGRGAFILQNNPRIDGTLSFSDKADVIRVGRNGNYNQVSVAAINAMAFVPHVDASRTQTAGVVSWAADLGTIIPVTLSANTNISNPARQDVVWDVGREVEFPIVGHASNSYTVTWGTDFVLAGGAYTHSGAGKTDVLRFRYIKIDTGVAKWIEVSRAMNLASW